MTGQIANRWQLAATGALGGALLWSVVESADRGLLAERPSLLLAALIGSLFAALLAMAGPIGLVRAAPRALGLALLVTLLLWLGLGRFAEPGDIFNTPLPTLAGLVVAALPIPFLIAQARGNWRDYGALFLEAWSVVVRYAAAWAFTGVVWLVIFLSDQLLQIVGVTAIGDLMEYWVVPLLITGAVLGLGMAVVHELAELLSPYLVLRLFRLLLPAVLLVMAVFLVALPFQGVEGLITGLSPAMLMLTMVGAGIALVATAVDQSDAEATHSPLIRRSAQAMALLLPLVAGLAGWAIWLRVVQYGWTPERLFVALLALVGLAYAVLYALAVLRGAGWMQRIREGNIWMALAVIALAALWLTPVMNAEAISARDQLARFEDGRTPLDDLDLAALDRWGTPGAAVRATLEARAKEPGQEALASKLAGETDDSGMGEPELVAELSAVLALQPAGATGTRDTLLAGAPDYQLQDWVRRCGPPGTATQACLMVVADLLPDRPGEEALLILTSQDGYNEVLGLYLDDSGFLATRSALRPDGRYVSGDEAAALMQEWMAAPPPLTPARINQLGTGESGLMILP